MSVSLRSRAASIGLAGMVAATGWLSVLPAHASPAPCEPVSTHVSTPDPYFLNDLYAVEATSSDDVWAVGARSHGALSMHWDGASWTEVRMAKAPDGSRNVNASDVASIAPDDTWAVGFRQLHGGPTRVFIEHWDGAAWSYVRSPDTAGQNSMLWSVGGAATDDVWAFGGTATDDYRDHLPLALHWDGTGWTRVPMELPRGRDSAFDGFALATDDVWAVGSRWLPRSDVLAPIIEHWDGDAWSIVPSPRLDSTYQYLSAVDGTTDDLWAVGSAIGVGPLLEHWDGSEWSLVDPELDDAGVQRIVDISYVSPTDIWMLAQSTTGDTTIHFDGVRWVVSTADSGARRPSAIGASPTGDVWVVGSRSTYTGIEPLVTELCPSRPAPGGFAPAETTTGYPNAFVSWAIPEGDPGTYRLTDASGLDLFDSGALAGGSTFSFRFPAAGTFTVADEATGGVQTVGIRPDAWARPRLGPTAIKVAWAAAPPSGLVVDVQMRPPGSEVFGPLLDGRADMSAYITADAGPGTYRFRTRLRDPATNEASGWSPPVRVTIGA
jgi:hypothetical protein